MFGVPLFVFFYIRSTYHDYLFPDENMYAGLAAVFATNLTMFCIAVWKYWEDFKAVFIDGTGDIPYDPALRDAINTGSQQSIVEETEKTIDAKHRRRKHKKKSHNRK